MKPTFSHQKQSGYRIVTSPNSSAGFNLDALRERMLANIFYVIAILGVAAYSANLVVLLRENRIITLGLYSFMLITVLVFAIFHRIPYRIRAVAFLLILFALGVSDLLQDGLYGSGRIFLLILPIMTALLISTRARLVGMAASIGAIAGIGYLMVYGYIDAPQLSASTQNDSLLAWGIATLSFAMIVAAVAVSSGWILQRFTHSLEVQNQLAHDLELEQSQLERRIEERTAEIERRLLQLRTAAEINRTISSILDIRQLLPQVCELVARRFDLYYVGVFLVENVASGGDTLRDIPAKPIPFAILAAGTGEAGKRMLDDGHRLAVGGDSMIGWCTAHKQARIALDVGLEAVRFNNPFLPETRSELALPILAQNVVLGAMTVQSRQPSAFDQDDIIVLQSIADSLASAIENARLFAEVQTNLEEIRNLHRQYLEQSWNEEVAKRNRLEFTFEEPTASPEQRARQLEVPILLREQPIGKIKLESPISAEEPAIDWTPEELALIDAVTAQTALALENARLFDEVKAKAHQEELLNQIISKSQDSLSLDRVMKIILQEVVKNLQVSRASIRLGNQSQESEIIIPSQQASGDKSSAIASQITRRPNGSSKKTGALPPLENQDMENMLK